MVLSLLLTPCLKQPHFGLFFTRKLDVSPMARLKDITEELEPQKASTLRNNNELENF